MNLRDLQYVSAVAEHGSFTRAAQMTSVSQPALSNQIKKLEAELGQAIFVRAKTAVHLTPFGQALLAHVIDIQKSVAEIENLAKVHGHKKANDLRIGTTPTLAPYLAEYLRQFFGQICPGERLIVSEAYPTALADLVNDGEIDIAFIAQKSFAAIQETFNGAMAFAPLWDEEVYLAVREGHPLANGQAIYAHDVPADQLIRFPIPFGFALEARLPASTGEAFDMAGIDMKTARFQTVCRQLVFCDACTLVNAVAAKRLQRDETGLHFIPFQDPDRCRVLGVLTRAQPAGNDLVAKIKTFSATQAPEGTTPVK